MNPRPEPRPTLLPALPRGPLEGARGALLVLLLALVSGLPFLEATLLSDDHLFLAPEVLETPALELFDFGRRAASPGAPRLEAGFLPWWTHPDFRMRFGRPLAAWSHALDYRLAPGDARVARAHNLAWFALALLAAWGVFREVFRSPVAALLAAVVLAFLPHTAMLIGWVAARNALMAVALGSGAVLAHLRWRRRGERRWLAASLGALGLGLLANEGTCAALGFLAAAALTLEEGRLRDRLGALLPALGLAVAWYAWYRAEGLGVRASGLYLEPDPTRGYFWGELLRRWAVYLASVLGMGLGADLALVGTPAFRVAFERFEALKAGLALLLYWPFMRRDRVLAFWVLAGALAVLPSCMAVPSERVLGLAALALAGLVARLVQASAAYRPGQVTVRVFLLRFLALYMLFRFVFLHPVLRHRIWRIEEFKARVLRTAALEGDLGARDLGGKRLVLANPPTPIHHVYIPAIRQLEGRDTPEAMRVLFPGPGQVRITRVGPRVVVAETDSSLFEAPFARLPRTPEAPFRVGDEVALSDVTYRVEAVAPDGAPTRVRLTFRGDPGGPPYLWGAWRWDRYWVFELPPVGHSRVLGSGPAGAVFLDRPERWFDILLVLANL